MKSKLTLLACAVLALTACNTPSDTKVAGASTEEAPFDKQATITVIDSLNKKYADAMLKGDSAAVVAMFTSDGKVLPPNEAEAGAAAMGTMIKGLPQSGITKIIFKTDDLFGSGEYVTEAGHYEMGDSTRTFEKGKYLVVWKKQNGQWKLHRDIWNSNAPGPKH
jgi:ketosteroid isomerase-like protein